MNRELFKKIDRVILKLLKDRDAGQERPHSYVIHELSKLLDTLNVLDDIPQEDWGLFAEFRASIDPRHSAGADGKEVWKRVDRIGPYITRALASPMPVSKSRFPQVLDDEFRDVLDRDMEEAESSFAQENWKACMVLCGSLLEAALYEYFRRGNGLWAMGLKGAPEKGPKAARQIRDITSNEEEDKWTLDTLVKLACEHGILEKGLQGFYSGGVREPRNLVHVAAELRKKHRVGREQAESCLAVLKQALKRISEAKGPPP